MPRGRSSNGVSDAITSASFGPAGSAGDSPRPTRDTTFSTPRTCSICCCIDRSMLNDSASEMFGTRSALGDSVPSAISGINDVPSSGTSASDTTNKPATISTLARR